MSRYAGCVGGCGVTYFVVFCCSEVWIVGKGWGCSRISWLDVRKKLEETLVWNRLLGIRWEFCLAF